MHQLQMLSLFHFAAAVKISAFKNGLNVVSVGFRDFWRLGVQQHLLQLLTRGIQRGRRWILKLHLTFHQRGIKEIMTEFTFLSEVFLQF